MNYANVVNAQAFACSPNPIYPFDKLQSLALENPLFFWFLAFALALGIWFAVALSIAHRRSRTMSLSLDASGRKRIVEHR